MTLLGFYRQVILMALRHVVDRAQGVVFILLLLTGVATALLPQTLQPFMPDMTRWEPAGYALVAVVAIRLALAPYWIWKEQSGHLADAQAALRVKSADPEYLRSTPRYIRLKLMLDANSPLSPEERLNRAKSEFESLAEEAETGDIESAFFATCVAEWLQDSARYYYASSAPFHQILGRISERLERLHHTIASRA